MDSASVGSLAKSWSVDGLVNATGTPVVDSGVAFFGDWRGQVHAVEAGTGQALWSTSLGGGDVVGSPAVSGPRVFVALGKTLCALDRNSGRVLWSTVTDANQYSQINASPVAAGPK